MATELIVALDTDDLSIARAWVSQLSPTVKWFKVGLQMFVKFGPDACRWVTDSGSRLFLDLKFHDIPNTVAGAVRSARNAGAEILTVHGGGGPAMLRQAVESAGQEAIIAAVTVLTSLDTDDLHAVGVDSTPQDQVIRLARLAHTCGVPAIVCSPQEVALVRNSFNREELKLIVPGIRPQSEGAAKDDQKRIMTPADAARAGADYLVVGRPITQAADPLRTASAILEEIAGA
ncbi:MAG: orotidine-5'-phosphate decarboxylase [Verrucomicrobiota bacterium]|jgi:orotidine-5'-phosphate decarboxylase|nr:orotidine-5'-phosphate decarboxylase [Verrucomicrobiota bacterium]